MKDHSMNQKGRAMILAVFMILPLTAWSQDQGVDVEKFQDALTHDIDHLKAQGTTPAPVPEAKVEKTKVAKKHEIPTTASEKKETKVIQHRSELDELKAMVSQLAQKVGSLDGQASSFKFNLLLQGRGYIADTPNVKIGGNSIYQGMDDGTVPGPISDEFLFRRSEMKFSGGFSNNIIQYVVMIDPVGVPAATKNLVQDYFMTLSPVRYLDLTFGQTKYPQGLEARSSSAKLEFINRSILGSGNGFGDNRDLIVQLSGTKVPLVQDLTLDYALAAVNGQGRNNPENNNKKDGAARLGLQYKGLWLGASGYDGFEQAQGVTTHLEMWRVGAEAQLILESVLAAKDNLKFQSEWGQGSLVNENGVTKAAYSAATGGKGASGFYLESLYRFSNTRFGIRYELWDPKDVSFSSAHAYQNYFTLGWDQYFSDDHLRLSVDWIHPILDNQAGGTLTVGELAETQAQLTF